MDHEELLMRQALKVCKTIQDFEHLLDTLRPLHVEANFGVIDVMEALRKWKRKDLPQNASSGKPPVHFTTASSI